MEDKRVCAIVAWCSSPWTKRIAESAKEGLVGSSMIGWEITLIDGGSFASRVGDSGRGARQDGPHYRLHVVQAKRLSLIDPVVRVDLAGGNADLVVVDCTIADLEEACHAVQAMPRWPLAWQPRFTSEDDRASLKTLVGRVVERLETLASNELFAKV